MLLESDAEAWRRSLFVDIITVGGPDPCNKSFLSVQQEFSTSVKFVLHFETNVSVSAFCSEYRWLHEASCAGMSSGITHSYCRRGIPVIVQ